MVDLVSMKVTTAFGKWFPGMVAGFTAEQAKNIHARGLADYVNPPAKSSPAPAQAGAIDEVAIPDDWGQQHHMKIIALAKSIAGDAAPASLTMDAAKAIINDELARRAETKGA